MRDVEHVLRGVSLGTHLRIERLSSGRAEGTLRERHADAVTLGNGEVLERITFLDMKAVWRKATFAFQGGLIGGFAALVLCGLLAANMLSLAAGFLVGKVLLVVALIVIVMGALFGAALGAWVPRWVKVWG